MEGSLDTITRLLPLLIPLVLVQLGLMIFALIDLLKQPTLRGSKWLWLLIVIFVNIIGPILYFVLAKRDE
jgi:hypothetical protein